MEEVGKRQIKEKVSCRSFDTRDFGRLLDSLLYSMPSIRPVSPIRLEREGSDFCSVMACLIALYPIVYEVRTLARVVLDNSRWNAVTDTSFDNVSWL